MRLKCGVGGHQCHPSLGHRTLRVRKQPQGIKLPRSVILHSISELFQAVPNKSIN